MRAVSTAVGLEAPTLDSAGEALTLGSAGHVDLSALFEQVGGQFLASLELIDVVGAHLNEVATRGDTSLGKVASQRLGHLGRVDGAVAELDSLVAVGFLGLHGSHHIGGHVDKSNGHEEAVLVPHLGHAELLAQQSLAIRHNASSSLTA